MDLCVDCAHFGVEHEFSHGGKRRTVCKLRLLRVNPVDGVEEHQSALIQRTNGICGPEGKLWEPKPKRRSIWELFF